MNIQKKRDQRASAPGTSKGRKERVWKFLTGARVTGDLVLKKGFTLVELLVVMVIIAMLAALLLPAIRKSRSKAMVDKARAEESNLAGIEVIVKGDVGWYIRLCDLGDGTLALSTHAGYPVADGTAGGLDLPGTYTLAYTDKTNDSTAVESELTRGTAGWDGPYQVFQEKSVLATDRGSIPTLDTSGTAVSGWGASPAVAYGTPLDPWGHPYLLAYDNRSIASGDAVDGELAMIIYSAGPDGVLQTGGRATKVGDANADGTVEYTTSDDIIYKFR